MRVILLIVIGISLSYASDTVNDSKTGLTWQDNSAAKNTKMNWTEARSYCSDLSLAGHSDWRLPSIKELLSIVDISKHDPAIKSGFKQTASGCYWSSSWWFVSDTEYARIVDFYDGSTQYLMAEAYERYVRCVRGRQ